MRAEVYMALEDDDLKGAVQHLGIMAQRVNSAKGAITSEQRRRGKPRRKKKKRKRG